MALPNQVWDAIISQASKNVEFLKDLQAVKQLGNILKTNVRACKALGHPYVHQLGKIYLDMLNVYKVMSENISSAISLHGENVTKQLLIRSMRTVKKETLKLISGWVSRSTDRTLVVTNFIPHLLEAVLTDYQRNIPQAREPEVLSTMATVVNKLESHITKDIPPIFDAVFECTLDMINKNFEEYPEHRINFFLLLQAVNSHCFPALLNIPAPQFKLVLDSVIWALKHTMRNVNDTGLEIMLQLLKNVESRGAQGQEFYKTYLLEVLSQVFGVVTDATHMAGLQMHCQILCHIFKSLENGTIAVPLYPEPNESNTDWLRANFNEIQNKNIEFVKNYIAELLQEHFKTLQIAQMKVFVTGLFTLDNDLPKFKEHIRDFLVEIKEFAGEDLSHLFLDQREEELRIAAEQKRAKLAAVPGALNPHEIKEEGIDGE